MEFIVLHTLYLLLAFNILFGFHSIVEYWEVKVFLIVRPLVIIIREWGGGGEIDKKKSRFDCIFFKINFFVNDYFSKKKKMKYRRW